MAAVACLARPRPWPCRSQSAHLQGAPEVPGAAISGRQRVFRSAESRGPIRANGRERLRPMGGPLIICERCRCSGQMASRRRDIVRHIRLSRGQRRRGRELNEASAYRLLMIGSERLRRQTSPISLAFPSPPLPPLTQSAAALCASVYPARATVYPMPMMDKSLSSPLAPAPNQTPQTQIYVAYPKSHCFVCS